ncbi:unnamed protein product, partial [Rotaria sp. Silwood2]
MCFRGRNPMEYAYYVNCRAFHAASFGIISGLNA